MKTDYKFFTCAKGYEWGSGFILIVTKTDNTGGWLFHKDGTSYSGTYADKTFTLDNSQIQAEAKRQIELNLESGFKLLTPYGKKNVCKILNIRKSRVVVSKEKKQYILNILKENRAMNADSAIDISDCYETCMDLVDLKIINYVSFLNNETRKESHGFYLNPPVPKKVKVNPLRDPFNKNNNPLFESPDLLDLDPFNAPKDFDLNDFEEF